MQSIYNRTNEEEEGRGPPGPGWSTGHKARNSGQLGGPASRGVQRHLFAHLFDHLSMLMLSSSSSLLLRLPLDGLIRSNRSETRTEPVLCVCVCVHVCVRVCVCVSRPRKRCARVCAEFLVLPDRSSSRRVAPHRQSLLLLYI
eukprot:9012075-Pyramimonas_sp.AAC.1